MDTPYNKLPDEVRKHIDDAYNYYIKPTTVALDEINRYRPDQKVAGAASGTTGGATVSINSLQALNDSLRKASVAAIRLDNKQKRLKVGSKNSDKIKPSINLYFCI